MPHDEASLTAFLTAMGIGFTRTTHPPLHTVEESRALRGDLPGAHVKNMFLKDKKGVLVLVTCREDRRIRIGDLEKRIGTKRLSFADADLLWLVLGVRPGSVTPLALVNDGQVRVRMILDAQLLDQGLINVHPLHNAATLTLATADLLRVFAATGHRAEPVDFDELEAGAGREGLAPGPGSSR